MTLQRLGSVLHGALGIRYQRPFHCALWNGGMNLSWVNARVICKNDGCGHCDVWTKVEAYLAAQPLVIFCYVCAQLDIPVFLPNFGGTAAASIFFDVFLAELTGYDEYESFQNEISILISIEPTGTHLFNSRIRSHMWTSLSSVPTFHFSSSSVCSWHHRVQDKTSHLLLLPTFMSIFGVTIKVYYLCIVLWMRTNIGSMN